MTDKYTDIRARLEAAAGVSLTEPEVLEDDSATDWIDMWAVRVRLEIPQAEALVAFIRQAPEDIRRLLEEVQDQ
jgi:hypothetical protein